MNLKVQANHTVNTWEAGAVVPTSAVEGGIPEAERLIALGAVVWTSEPATAFAPAAMTAVAEMPDDELTRENARLKAELEKAKADARDAHAKLSAAREQEKAAPPKDVNPHDADKNAAGQAPGSAAQPRAEKDDGNPHPAVASQVDQATPQKPAAHKDAHHDGRKGGK